MSAAAQERNVTVRRMHHRFIIPCVAWLVLFAADVQAQDALARAKDLYLSAAYDEALVLLDQLKSQPPPAGTEAEQYRVFCLLALERSEDARKAIEDIVAADPTYRPSDTQTSPRIRSVFQDTRKALLPGLVQRRYADAKAAFERKDPNALSAFEQLLTLLDDPDVKAIAQLSDLRTVVSGFRDLSKAIANVPPPLARPIEPVPTVQRANVTTLPAAAAVEPVAGPIPDGALGFMPPVVISQPLPRWAPPGNVDRRTGFKGLIEVAIDENGNVTSATVQQSVHPLYDEKLLAMARTWKYKPALRNGVPTPSLKVVEIQLQPAR